MLDLHELAAGKLAALLARHASRDLFDAHGLLQRGGLDMAKLRLGFVVYGALNRKDWRTVSVEDVSFDATELMNELLPVLCVVDAEQLAGPATWAYTLLNECRQGLSIVLPLADPEREFLDRILDYGEIVPTLLTNDPDIVHRIASQPMLQWKAQNVRQHKSR